jgi:pilus assembly protein CpaF
MPIGPADLLANGTLGYRMLEFLAACVPGRMNIVISGGTSSGKTTLLGVLSSFVPQEERLITIEDAAELRLAQPHVIGLEARPASVEGRGEVTVRDLVRNALRMRPDRIVVGEVRGGEALDMLQAMNTGHDGSLTTAHANSTRHALWRLETMALMSDVDQRPRVGPASVPRPSRERPRNDAKGWVAPSRQTRRSGGPTGHSSTQRYRPREGF